MLFIYIFSFCFCFILIIFHNTTAVFAVQFVSITPNFFKGSVNEKEFTTTPEKLYKL